MSSPGDPPLGYETPSFPSLNVQTLQDRTPQRTYTLYHISDVWKFTVIWTLITYTTFHLGAVFVALFNHGLKGSSWRYLWAIPITYLLIAGVEGLLAGSIVGLMYVGACVYSSVAAKLLGKANVSLRIKARSSVQGRLLRDEYVDPLYMGLHQRHCPHHLVVFCARRPLKMTSPSAFSFRVLNPLSATATADCC